MTCTCRRHMMSVQRQAVVRLGWFIIYLHGSPFQLGMADSPLSDDAVDNANGLLGCFSQSGVYGPITED
jgi:hypothetical protein